MKGFYESMAKWGFGWVFWTIALCMVGAWLFVRINYKKNNSRNLRNALPGIYTSLGLLGTFLSIWYSLSNISTIDKYDKDFCV